MKKNTGNFHPPSAEESLRLYQLADRIKEMAPWKWMYEDDIFGVRNSVTGELGFISVMGNAGEHFAVSVYLGSEGLDGFWAMEQGLLEDDMNALLEIPQIQISFEDRDELKKEDREVIKKLGLKYRGQKAWPMFRSFRAGYLPWFITSEEAQFLAQAMEQLLDVAPRVRETTDLLVAKDGSDDVYLVRTHLKGTSEWHDQMIAVPPPEPKIVRVQVTQDSLEQAAKLPLMGIHLEMDFFSLPTPVGEKGQRPYFPLALLVAESQSGAILGFEMIPPLPNLDEAWEKLPQSFLDSCVENGSIPGTVTVRSERHFAMLSMLSKKLNFKLHQSDELPALDDALDELMQMMGGSIF